MSFSAGDVIVHKTLGSQPLVVLNEHADGTVTVRYGTQTQDGVDFKQVTFYGDEVETPVESIEREGAIFKVLNAKRQEIQDEADNKAYQESAGVVPINKLN